MICSGISIGLPGGERSLIPEDSDAMLSGENRISSIPQPLQDRIISKNWWAGESDEGQGSFEEVSERDEVLHLANARLPLTWWKNLV